jgi:hypothetical protein
MNYFEKTGHFKYDNLISDISDINVKGVLLAKGQGIIKRGTILGKGSDGKHYVMGNENEGITLNVDGILTDDADTTENDKIGMEYVSGIFNKAAVICGDGYTIDERELRKLNITFKTILKEEEVQ